MARKAKANEKVLQLAIEGELTIFRVAELKEVIMPAISLSQEVEVDLSRVSDIDAAGLQLMISAKLEAWEHSKTLHFIGHSATVTDAIDLCGLSGFFGDPIHISSRAA